MASWTRANVGAFVAGARLRWDLARDEFAAWRVSINNVEDAQFVAGGDTFGIARMTNDAAVLSWNLNFTGFPVQDNGAAGYPIFNSEVPLALIPVGAFRIRRDVVLRTAQMTTLRNPSANYAQAIVVSVGDPATEDRTLPQSLLGTFFTVRLVDREKARLLRRPLVVATQPIRRPGDLVRDAVAPVVMGPIDLSERILRMGAPGNTFRVGLGPDINGTEPYAVAFSRDRFAAGDVLVACVELPPLGGQQPSAGLTTRVEQQSEQFALHVEFAADHV